MNDSESEKKFIYENVIRIIDNWINNSRHLDNKILALMAFNSALLIYLLPKFSFVEIKITSGLLLLSLLLCTFSIYQKKFITIPGKKDILKLLQNIVNDDKNKVQSFLDFNICINEPKDLKELLEKNEKISNIKVFCFTYGLSTLLVSLAVLVYSIIQNPQIIK